MVKRTFLSLAVSIWFAAVCAGLWMMFQYESTPARATAAAAEWPANSPIAMQPGAPNLLFFVHPQCPCTRASVAELSRLIARVGPDRVHVVAVACHPANTAPDWLETDTVNTLTQFPGIQIADDLNGALARRFGAQVSGEALLYDELGRLLYQGGVTGARGHEGDNAARDALEARILRRESALMKMPTFGCSLFSEAMTKE